MKTFAVRAALLASVCLAVTACGDAVAPMASDIQGPGLRPTAAFSESAADTVPGKYLPTSGNETPTESEPGKYLPTSGDETTAESEPGKYLPTSGNETTAESEPGKYLPTSGSETPDGGGADLTPESGTGGETGETPAEQR